MPAAVAILFLIFLITNIIIGRWLEVLIGVFGIIICVFLMFLFSYTDKID